jgi:hypothetical protein
MRMSPLLASLAIAGGLAVADAFAKAPADATGECKDGPIRRPRTEKARAHPMAA